jgi:hypothetical protein
MVGKVKLMKRRQWAPPAQARHGPPGVSLRWAPQRVSYFEDSLTHSCSRPRRLFDLASSTKSEGYTSVFLTPKMAIKGTWTKTWALRSRVGSIARMHFGMSEALRTLILAVIVASHKGSACAGFRPTPASIPPPNAHFTLSTPRGLPVNFHPLVCALRQ